MNEYPEFVFTCDSSLYYEWVEEIDPEMFERDPRARRRGPLPGRRRLVGRARLQHPGRRVVRPPGAVRQRYFLEKFGGSRRRRNVDPFGHNAMIPQILREERHGLLRLPAPGPHEKALPAPLFWWESPDGSRVLAYRIPHEYCAPREDLGDHLDKSIAQLPTGWPR
jgi:alpha-mannosidase